MTLPPPIAIVVDGKREPLEIDGRIRRRFRPERLAWAEGDRSERPYLMAHPYREIASEILGVGYCPACVETYNPGLVEWLVSPGILAARRWALRHNLERHPRRARRASH